MTHGTVSYLLLKIRLMDIFSILSYTITLSQCRVYEDGVETYRSVFVLAKNIFVAKVMNKQCKLLKNHNNPAVVLTHFLEKS